MPGEAALMLATEISRQNVAKEGWTTYYVSKDGNDGANGLKWESAFLTIQRAIDKAESWAKIYVATGTYTENVTINKENLRLIGEKKETTIIRPSSGSGITITTNHVHVENFDSRGIGGTIAYGIRLHGDWCTVKQCITSSTAATVSCGIEIKGSYNMVDSVTIDNATEIWYNGIRIYSLTGAKYNVIKNCKITVGAIGINIDFAAEWCEIKENDIYDCVAGNGLIIGASATNKYNRIFHNNFINNFSQVADDGGLDNSFFENFYDDHTVDTNNDGLTDTPYVFAGGTDYTPVSKRNGWLQESLGVLDVASINLNKVSCMDFWSVMGNIIDLPAVAADIDCPNIVVSGIPAGATWLKVLGMMQPRAIENVNAGGSNGIKGAQNIRIKKSTGAWATDDVIFLPLVDNQWLLAASTKEGGGGIIVADDGNECSSEVDENATYNIRFEDALVDLASLRLHDIKVGLRVYFT